MSRAEVWNWRAAVRRAVPKPLLWRVNSMRLHWWDDPNRNFGDQLSPLLIRRLFDIDVCHSGMNACDLVGLGSLLEGLENAPSDLHPIVWGSGFLRGGVLYQGPEVRLRAVRGRLSLERFGSRVRAGTSLGDPGLLASLAFPEFVNLPKRHRIGLVPHFLDRNKEQVVTTLAARSDVHVIDVLAPPETVLEEIAACELVVSSSLHGLVVAESFGVPNVWTILSPDWVDGRYKFNDYYSAFGVEGQDIELPRAIENADEFVRDWRPLPGLKAIQEGLIKAFPIRMGRLSGLGTN